MSFDELLKGTIKMMKEDIKAGRAILKYSDGSYVIFGEDGDTKVSESGVEFRTIEDVRKGKGF